MDPMQNSVTKHIGIGLLKSSDFSDFHFICLLKHGVFDMPGIHLSIQERFFFLQGHTRCNYKDSSFIQSKLRCPPERGWKKPREKLGVLKGIFPRKNKKKRIKVSSRSKFSGWWFQTFLIFIPTWGRFPI